jgi:hypothetical protein
LGLAIKEVIERGQNSLEVCKQAAELGMERKDAAVHHVWVGDEQLCTCPDLCPLILRRVTIIHL